MRRRSQSSATNASMISTGEKFIEENRSGEVLRLQAGVTGPESRWKAAPRFDEATECREPFAELASVRVDVESELSTVELRFPYGEMYWTPGILGKGLSALNSNLGG